MFSSPSPARPIWRKGWAVALYLAAGCWDRKGQCRLSGVTAALQAGDSGGEHRGGSPSGWGPETPLRLSGSCFPRTPGRAAASRDGSALSRPEQVRPALLFSHVASSTEGPATLACEHTPPGGCGRGRAWRVAGRPPVPCSAAQDLCVTGCQGSGDGNHGNHGDAAGGSSPSASEPRSSRAAGPPTPHACRAWGPLLPSGAVIPGHSLFPTMISCGENDSFESPVSNL